jgi:hypothetical protein
VSVGCAQGADINAAQIICGDRIAASPAQAGPAKTDREQVGGKAGESSIAVWERVNEDQPMMEADGDFIRRCL